MNLGNLDQVSVYNELENSLEVFEATEDRVGYWRFSVLATETRFNQTFTYEKSFYLHILAAEREQSAPDLSEEAGTV